MKLAVLKESNGEPRVAVTPENVANYAKLEIQVAVENDAGSAAGFSDADYKQAGAELGNLETVLDHADGLACVACPATKILECLNSNTLVTGLLSNAPTEFLQVAAKQSISLFALERLPRISRAQSMDVLSSQSNLAGYKAVIDAVAHYGRMVPMMMTAAGTIRPAKVLVLGAGVAGLQAIATAKRLGAVVSAFDVRAAAREQVQSLGAEFIAVDDEASAVAETQSGYAKEMSADYQARQAKLIHETLITHDIAICTALIPGKTAPVLITKEMIDDMSPGSVIVDLAVSQGGNCELSEADKIIVANKVSIIAHTNTPGRLAYDASRLYANNMQHFIANLIDSESKKIHINCEDEIIKATLLEL